MAAIAEFKREKQPETLTVSDFRYFFLRQGAVLRTWQGTPVRRALRTVRASSLVKRFGLCRFAHALDNSLVARVPAAAGQLIQGALPRPAARAFPKHQGQK